jgi:hypothetical protein
MCGISLNFDQQDCLVGMTRGHPGLAFDCFESAGNYSRTNKAARARQTGAEGWQGRGGEEESAIESSLRRSGVSLAGRFAKLIRRWVDDAQLGSYRRRPAGIVGQAGHMVEGNETRCPSGNYIMRTVTVDSPSSIVDSDVLLL